MGAFLPVLCPGALHPRRHRSHVGRYSHGQSSSVHRHRPRLSGTGVAFRDAPCPWRVWVLWHDGRCLRSCMDADYTEPDTGHLAAATPEAAGTCRLTCACSWRARFVRVEFLSCAPPHPHAAGAAAPARVAPGAYARSVRGPSRRASGLQESQMRLARIVGVFSVTLPLASARAQDTLSEADTLAYTTTVVTVRAKPFTSAPSLGRV